MNLRITLPIVVNDADLKLCSDACPAFGQGEGGENICGAFSLELEPATYDDDVELEDADGNLLFERCKPCLKAVLP